MTTAQERDAFVEAILAAPGDPTPRLVYCDWLEERGEEGVAACLRREDGRVRIVETSGGLSAHWFFNDDGLGDLPLGPVHCHCSKRAYRYRTDTPRRYLCRACSDARRD